MPHHVKSCCKESLGKNPFDALNTVDRQLTSLTALFRDIYILLRGLALWLLCSTFKSENDILSNLPVRVIAVAMNALTFLGTKALFSIIRQCSHALQKRNIPFRMSCIIHAKTPPFLLIHLVFCYPFEHCKMKAFCIERTGGCETSVRIWIVALRAGGKKNIKRKNHSDGRRSRDLSRY